MTADSPAPAGFAGLPGDAYVDPETIIARRGNYLSERTRLGDEYFAKAANATVSATGHFVQLIAGERQPSWAVYRFDNLLDEDAPLVLTVEVLPQLAESHYLGLADYASGKWRWYQIADQPQGYTVGIPAKLDLVSPGGSVYVAVLLWDGDPAVIVRLTLGAHVIAPPPVGLEASDGGYGSRIVLTWEDPAITYPGLEYDAIQIERENRAEDTWELIAEVVPGTVTYSDVHDGADNYLGYWGTYHYRLRTVEDGVAGPPGLEDYGYRTFPPVTGVSATDGEYFDKVVITWDPMDEADGYVIYYYDWMSESSPLITLTGGSTTSFEHTALSPEVYPCQYAEVVKYAVVATYLGDPNYLWYEGINDSVDTGYRILNPPAGIQATDGDHPDKIRLSWSKAHGAEGYKIYRDGIDPENVVATLGDSSYWYDAVEDFDVHTYRIRSVHDAILSEFSDPDDGYRNRFVIHEVDKQDDGYEVSLAVIDGKPAICYYAWKSGTDYSLKFARALTEAPEDSEDWIIHVVDSADDNVGDGCCLAVIDGKPAISYLDNYTDELKYARALTGTPSSSGDWTIHAVSAEDTSVLYGDTELIELAGAPAICYIVLGWAAFAHATTATPSAGGDWLIHTVNGCSEPLSLILLNGRPAFTPGYLGFSHATTTTPGSPDDWETHVVDTDGHAGSLVVIDGRPAISYKTGWYETAALMFAYAITDSPRFSSDWLKHEVSRPNLGGGHWGFPPSLAIVGGRPALAWLVPDGEDSAMLNFAWSCVTTPTVGTDWEIRVVHRTPDGAGIGRECRVAELNGKPIIAYDSGPYFGQGQ